MSAVEEIRIKLQSRLSAVEAEIESLREALDALDADAADPSGHEPRAQASSANGASTPRRRRRSPRASTRANGGARPARESSAELERLLAETGGMTAVALARETGTDYGVVLARIRQLEQAGKPRS